MKLSLHPRAAPRPVCPLEARSAPREAHHVCCAVAKPASLTDAAAPASTGAAPSRNAGVAQRPAHAARKSPGRVVVVAVDGTDEGVESLHWLAENCFKAGDRIQLVTVVTNDRAVPISVGMTSPTGRVLTISLDEDFGYERTKAYGQRLADEAQAQVDAKYKPVVEAAGFEVATGVNVVDGHASAAGIAESIVASANDAGADILAVTSHGGGLKCSYGSVARYCVTHFHRAILLVPPGMGSHEHRASPSLTIGVNHVKELQDATTWGVDNLLNEGDTLHVLRAEEAAMAAEDSTHQNVIMAGLREQLQRHNIKDLTYTLLQPAGAADVSAEESNELYAAEMLRKAAEKRSKALVMVNYATRGLMQEMMFGTLAMMVSRGASLPLALIPADYAVE